MPLSITRWDSDDGFRNNNFDLFRLLLASIVIFSHAYPITLGMESGYFNEPLYRLSDGLLNFGTLAVYSFFSISGFLITRSAEKAKGKVDFLTKRVRRIVPGFIVAFVISFFIAIACYGIRIIDINLTKNLLRAVCLMSPSADASFVHNPLPNTINGSMWSIRYEFICYLITLTFLFVRFNHALVLVALELTFVCTANFFLRTSPPIVDNFMFLKYLDMKEFSSVVSFYLSGKLLYLSRAYVKPTFLLILVALGVVVAGLMLPRLNFYKILIACYGFPFAMSYLTLCIAYIKSPTLGRFKPRIDISYGLYLYGFVVQQAIVQVTNNHSVLFNFSIGVFISILFGFLSWHLVEKRFLDRARNYKSEVSNTTAN